MLYPVLNHKSPIPIVAKSIIHQLYIKSAITYAGPAWGPLLFATSWKRLEAVWNISLWVMTGQPTYVANQNLRNSFNIPSLKKAIRTNAQSIFHRNSFSSNVNIKNLGRSVAHQLISKKPRLIDWTK